MALKIYSTASPKGFRSKTIENNLLNLGKLPALLGRLGSLITGEIKKNLSGRILQKRTGNLYDSWSWTIRAMSMGWKLLIGSDVAYARIHNFGGFTGRDHKTKIAKSRYVDRAVIAKKKTVRVLTRQHLTRITRG